MIATHQAGRTLLFLLAVLPLAAAAPPLRHNRLVKAEPGVEATVAKPPAVIRLWFKEAPEVSVSSIKLTDAAGAAIATGEVKATDDKTSIAVNVATALRAGKYTVTWKTAGADGHVIRGSFGFTVGA
jgi:copper resistance protein C